MLRFWVAVLIVVSSLFFLSRAQAMAEVKVAQAPASTPARPSKTEAVAVRMTGTVTAVNKEQSTVTLKGPQGRSVTIEVRDKAKLDMINVGDPVVAKYVEALVIEVKKPGTASGTVTTEEARVSSKPGETPAGMVGRAVAVTATITAIDKKRHTVTVKGPTGDAETIKARDPKNLDVIKVGDVVEVRYLQALAISLDKSAKK